MFLFTAVGMGFPFSRIYVHVCQGMGSLLLCFFSFLFPSFDYILGFLFYLLLFLYSAVFCLS